MRTPPPFVDELTKTFVVNEFNKIKHITVILFFVVLNILREKKILKKLIYKNSTQNIATSK